MLDQPHTLLGRLQRGRGDAVRELLGMPREVARQTLVQCLCTEGDLCQHDEAYVELVLALSPELSPWFRWIDALAPETEEETRIYAFNMLGELARRGHGAAHDYLRRHALTGRHWRDALSQFLVEGVELDLDAWSELLPRVDDDELELYVHSKPDSPLWTQLAGEQERVDRLLRERCDRHARYEGELRWSQANYANASLSQRRWRVLQSLLERDPEGAVPFLVDGLWDGSIGYRERCIAHCDLGWPGVRERLAELASMTGSRSAEAARRRLQADADIASSRMRHDERPGSGFEKKRARLNPYLTFNGQCEAALEYYAKGLGGRIDMMMKYGESPMASHVSPQWAEKILHATFSLGEQTLGAADVPPDGYRKPQGFSVTLNIDSPAEADRVFAMLAEKGTVEMPIQETFWALRFGMLTDQFGIPWMINCGKPT